MRLFTNGPGYYLTIRKGRLIRSAIREPVSLNKEVRAGLNRLGTVSEAIGQRISPSHPLSKVAGLAEGLVLQLIRRRHDLFKVAHACGTYCTLQCCSCGCGAGIGYYHCTTTCGYDYYQCFSGCSSHVCLAGC